MYLHLIHLGYFFLGFFKGHELRVFEPDRVFRGYVVRGVFRVGVYYDGASRLRVIDVVPSDVSRGFDRHRGVFRAACDSHGVFRGDDDYRGVFRGDALGYHDRHALASASYLFRGIVGDVLGCDDQCFGISQSMSISQSIL